MCSPIRAREHMPLVYAMARRLKIPDGEREDVLQAGFLGLVQAARRFDPGRGVQFSSYAVPLILGEMRACLRRTKGGHAGRRAQAQAAQLMALQETMMMQLGRAPSLRELAEQAGLSAEETAASLGAMLPFRSVEADGGDDHEQLQIPDGRSLEEESVNALAVHQALQQLEAGQRRLVELRFFENQTQKQVGEALGLSQAQISRMEKQALLHMRKALVEETDGDGWA